METPWMAMAAGPPKFVTSSAPPNTSAPSPVVSPAVLACPRIISSPVAAWAFLPPFAPSAATAAAAAAAPPRARACRRLGRREVSSASDGLAASFVRFMRSPLSGQPTRGDIVGAHLIIVKTPRPSHPRPWH